jgi:excisionase family DNA binding protein
MALPYDERHLDALRRIAYHSAMTHDETDNPPIDPLTVGELISLQEAAEYAQLKKDSLHDYIKRGRLRAKKIGRFWVTTRAAFDEYLQSRSLENIPKRHRKSS